MRENKKKKKSSDQKKISSDQKKIFHLLPIKKNYSFKWNKLIFEDDVPCIFHDSILNLKREQIFDFKVIYFRNLIVCFERIEKVLHRRKEKYCFITQIISGEVLLSNDK